MVDHNARANHADARIFMSDGGVDTGRMPLLPTRVMSIADGTPKNRAAEWSRWGFLQG